MAGGGPDTLRILMNSEVLAPVSGIAVQTLQVARALADRGHAIDLVFVEDGPLREEYAGFCRSVRRVPGLDLAIRGAIHQAPRLVPAVRAGVRTRPDVVYANRYRPLPWALSAGRLSSSPVVCHLHGVVGLGTPLVNRTLGRWTASFIAVSAYLRDEFVAAAGPAAKVRVVHNGIDAADYPVGGTAERGASRARLGIDPEAAVVLFYGRVAPEKGVDVLARAVAALAGRAPRAELVVMGPYLGADERRTLVALADPVPVHVLPPSTDVVTPLHAADVVAVPSVYPDPFPRTVLEGLCTGRPVVATRTGGIPEALTGDLARFLVPPSDVDALAAALDRTLGWRAAEPDLGTRCAAHVTTHFGKAAMVDAIEEHLWAAVRRARSGRSGADGVRRHGGRAGA